MTELERIKRHVDEHGFGCVVFDDHVAIAIAWRSEGVDGRERRMETTCRAACAILGCPYTEVDGEAKAADDAGTKGEGFGDSAD
jgi:hypothetical protein